MKYSMPTRSPFQMSIAAESERTLRGAGLHGKVTNTVEALVVATRAGRLREWALS